MTRKTRRIALAAAAIAAIGGIAVAAVQIEEASEKKVALDQVPAAVMTGAQTELSGIKGAELVTLKDGRTIYEVKGKDKAGKTVELYVDTDGKVLGTEGKEHDSK